jgi:CDP-diacylglycerol--glycerol-3-phosphate 3-phosphatidyltransferase
VLGERLGHHLDGLLYPVARRIRVDPNAITVCGFLVTALAAYALTVDLRLGGALVVVCGFLDVLDGAVARATGRVTKFGAYLDSVLDRYSDAFLFIGLGWHLSVRGETVGVMLSVATLVGALVISYARARAEGLGVDCKTGLLERPERMALIIFAAFSGWVTPVLWVMFPLTHLTVIQRVRHVKRAMRRP